MYICIYIFGMCCTLLMRGFLSNPISSCLTQLLLSLQRCCGLPSLPFNRKILTPIQQLIGTEEVPINSHI